jgi:hypothetical protein
MRIAFGYCPSKEALCFFVNLSRSQASAIAESIKLAKESRKRGGTRNRHNTRVKALIGEQPAPHYEAYVFLFLFDMVKI